MILEIQTDSETWLKIKHAIREAGLRYYLQEQMFSQNKTLFVEPRGPEPEGGKLVSGFIVYDGGSPISSPIHEIFEQETSGQPYLFSNKPAIKSTTNVASASTVCSTCGCRLGRGQVNTKNCQCNCHGTDRKPVEHKAS